MVHIEAGQELGADIAEEDGDALVLPDADDLAAVDLDLLQLGAVGGAGGADEHVVALGDPLVRDQHQGMLQLTYPDGVDVGAAGLIPTQLPVFVFAPAPDRAVGS